MKKFKRILLLSAFLLLVSCEGENRWDPSFAKLTKYQKKIATMCAERTGWNDKNYLVMYIPNEFAKKSRITINYSYGSFVRCDFKFNSTKLISAEHILDGKIAERF